MEPLSCAGGLVRPFDRLLANHSGISARTRARFRALAQQQRIDLQAGHDTLEYLVRTTGDQDLGLRAGRLMQLGEGGALDYAIRSAGTVREAVDVLSRHAHAFSDALQAELDIAGTRALIRLDNRVSWPRVAADFTLCAYYRLHARLQLMDAPTAECWFAHEEPANIDEYQAAFAGAKLRFGAPCYGFAFDADFVDAPLACGDAALHALHWERLGRGEERGSREFTACVRQLIVQRLPAGKAKCTDVARKLRLSRRTVVRRLRKEGTTFRMELDAQRREIALTLLSSSQTPLAEIATQAGFTSSSVLSRAVRRWTGRTPLQYRGGSAQEGP